MHIGLLDTISMDLASPLGALIASKALLLLLTYILDFHRAADDRTDVLKKTIHSTRYQWRLDAQELFTYFESVREKVLRWHDGCVAHSWLVLG